ncbi:MAG: hypothetical protein LBS49_07200, partial [Candidatus Accumulibacter sp.]|nr:hypothetical protein [Accumulibacter sp.]
TIVDRPRLNLKPCLETLQQAEKINRGLTFITPGTHAVSADSWTEDMGLVEEAWWSPCFARQ